jgi:hypothetical protein
MDHARVAQVVVPDGCGPGDVIEIELPTEAAATQQSTEPQQPMQSEEPQMTGEATAEYVGMHKIGAQVAVLRTNGAYTPATIKEYDEMSDTYTLEVEVRPMAGRLATRHSMTIVSCARQGGQLKYLVTEDEIAPFDHEPEKVGEHFVGRRVQVPTPGAESKDDVMGAVHSYDPRSGTRRVCRHDPRAPPAQEVALGLAHICRRANPCVWPHTGRRDSLRFGVFTQVWETCCTRK